MHLEILIAPLVIRGKRFPFTETIHLSNEKRNSSDPRIRIFQDFSKVNRMHDRDSRKKGRIIGLSADSSRVRVGFSLRLIHLPNL